MEIHIKDTRFSFYTLFLFPQLSILPLIELTSLQEAELIDPFSLPSIPNWYEAILFKDSDSFPIDRLWMIRPQHNSKATFSIDRYTYIRREPGGYFLHRAIDMTGGTYDCITEIVKRSDGSKLWRYRFNSEIPHHESILLAECLVIKPSGKGEFLLNFTIRAREIPEPIKETLILKVT